MKRFRFAKTYPRADVHLARAVEHQNDSKA